MPALPLSQERYIVYELTKEELWSQFANKRIAEAIAKDQWLKAQEIAIEWAGGICDRLGLINTGNWKFFKRSLVARWFGQVENKRFPPGWSVEEALQYASRFAGGSVRFSLFPEDIACHATSYRLPVDQREQWECIIAQTDNSVAMEMFPEASTDDTICFRRYTTQFGETVSYEAGKGQAMFVFEQERGQHPVVSATKDGEGYIYARIVPEDHHNRTVQENEAKLRILIKTHDRGLASKCFGLCRMLGIDYVSIEGYFDPTGPSTLTIVDLDLPFDFVFMGTASH